jgi:glycerol-3-phosphate dehydrogenase
MRIIAPQLRSQGLTGGFGYMDAQTDDARLVIRVLREGVRYGGSALNYVRAEALLWKDGRVVGVRIRDHVQGRTSEVYARVIINAAGVWVDQLRAQVGEKPRIRPLRGSHLVITAWRFPMPQAVSFMHPQDQRPVFVFAWEGATLIGTTDQDHTCSLDEEATIQSEEVDYLLAAINHRFPDVGITRADISATFSGVRPVIDTGKQNPSQESRDHAIWQEKGLLTVTGGKLSTFRVMALDALHAIVSEKGLLPRSTRPQAQPCPEQALAAEELSEAACHRLAGRYGVEAPDLLAYAQPGELTTVPGTSFLWAEVRWAAHAEGVMHLEDLLLRRVRLGLVLPRGGAASLPAIRAICQSELGWSDARWEAEEQAYRTLVRTHYSVPGQAENFSAAG